MPLIETIKANRLSEEVKADFLAHLEDHPTTHIYTDGSKMNQGVGYAAVTQDSSNSGALPSEASIFTAELYAIKATMEDLVVTGEERGNFTIFSDSRSALLALKKVR